MTQKLIQTLSPEIIFAKWGEIKVGESTYKDVKCFPGGSRAWDWNQTGTKHVPGIQIEDIEELVEKGTQVIVLSKGYHERLQTSPEAIHYLENKKIPFYILQTEKAIKQYNTLCADTQVGGLFHSTC